MQEPPLQHEKPGMHGVFTSDKRALRGIFLQDSSIGRWVCARRHSSFCVSDEQYVGTALSYYLDDAITTEVSWRPEACHPDA